MEIADYLPFPIRVCLAVKTAALIPSLHPNCVVYIVNFYFLYDILSNTYCITCVACSSGLTVLCDPHSIRLPFPLSTGSKNIPVAKSIYFVVDLVRVGVF